MPIALDTNVLVRFLTQDDTEQFEIAQDIINKCSAKQPAFICREVLVELVWVLERSYKYSRNEITAAVMGLISATELHVETAQDVAEILPLYQNEGFGFSDLMIRQAAIKNGGRDLQIFDRKAAKLAGITLLGTSH
jgi:predicted nucleic-acid-binding protein